MTYWLKALVSKWSLLFLGSEGKAAGCVSEAICKLALLSSAPSPFPFSGLLKAKLGI